MRLIAGRRTCEGHGICEALAPYLFEIDDENVVRLIDDHLEKKYDDVALDAVSQCPASALSTRDTG